MLINFTILLPFFVAMFWLIHFCLNRKRNTRAQNIWTIALGLLTVVLATSSLYWFNPGDYSLFYKLDIIDCFTTLSFMPVIYLYFREVTGGKGKYSALKTGLLFFPAILFGIVTLYFYLSLGEEQAAAFCKGKMDYWGNVRPDSLILGYIYQIINDYTYSLVLFAQAFIVFTYAIRRLIIYRGHLGDFFSNIDDKGLNHHWAVVWGLLALLLLTFVSGVMGYFLFVQYSTGVSVVMVGYAVVIYYICHHISCVYYIAGRFTQEEVVAGEMGKNDIYLKFLPQFNRVIDEEKIFLQKNLRLDDVASRVCTNRAYISRILKSEHNCNFWEFINRKRIEYAKEQAMLKPGLMVEELAEMCGFSHGTTFSRAFKQCEGVAFKEWRSQSLKNNAGSSL